MQEAEILFSSRNVFEDSAVLGLGAKHGFGWTALLSGFALSRYLTIILSPN